MERSKIEGGKTTEHQDPGKEDDLTDRVGKQGLALYLDTSAIVKKYVLERGSSEIIRAIAVAEAVGTARIAKVEMAAALAKALRAGLITAKAAQRCRKRFEKTGPVITSRKCRSLSSTALKTSLGRINFAATMPYILLPPLSGRTTWVIP